MKNQFQEIERSPEKLAYFIIYNIYLSNQLWIVGYNEKLNVGITEVGTLEKADFFDQVNEG